MTQAATPTLWRHPDFLRFWASRAVTMIGSSVTAVALPVLIHQLTGSPALTSALLATSTLSMALFGLVGGQCLFPVMTVLLVVLSRMDRYGLALCVYLVYAVLHVLVISATVTYRMQVIPERLLSRVSTASRTISWGGGATIGVRELGHLRALTWRD